MANSIIQKFNTECTEYFNSELNIRLLSSSPTDKSTISEYYLNEYQRCIDEQKNFVNYMIEQLNTLESLKAYESTLDKFMERLKSIHEYELKQNELFEQILSELTKTNSSSKEERLRLLEQIDELIASKAKLITNLDEPMSATNKLCAKSSDTFKNIL